MKWAFNLWSHSDDSGHMPGILAGLQNGSMPCDHSKQDAQIAPLRRWIEDGMPE